MILDFLKIAINLKKIRRQGWIEKLSIKNPESVADHTYSMAIIGMILSDLEKYDTEKILKMILIHDLAESLMGDFTPEQKSKEEKFELENKTFKKILKTLPENLQNQYFHIWNDYQTDTSKEANFVHQIDKLEMALQAKIYSKQLKSNDDLETFFNSAEQEVKNPKLLKLLKQILDK